MKAKSKMLSLDPSSVNVKKYDHVYILLGSGVNKGRCPPPELAGRDKRLAVREPKCTKYHSHYINILFLNLFSGVFLS